EYEDHISDAVWVKFPVLRYGWSDGLNPVLELGRDDAPIRLPDDLRKSAVVIWTTTPWTIPANRALAFSADIDYGLYSVDSAPPGNWLTAGSKLILADALAHTVFEQARIEAGGYSRIGPVPWGVL